MIREKMNQIIEVVSQKYGVDEITSAKAEYLGDNGAIFEDDKSYDSRMGSFLEWFVLERATGASRTPLNQYLENQNISLPAEEREIYESLDQGIHSLFQLKKVRPQSVVVTELFDDRKYEVQEEEGRFFFNKGDIFEGRLIPFQKKFYFTDNFCHHPKETANYIFSKVKILRIAEADNHKALKKMNKERDALKKNIDGLTKKINALQIKLEKAGSDTKKEKIQAKINPLNSDKTLREVEFFELENRIADWEEREMRIGHRTQRFNLIRRLSYMSLKWERYHNVDVRDIYKD